MRGNKVIVQSGEVTVLDWNAEAEEPDRSAWRSSLTSILMSYRIVDPNGRPVPDNDILNADLRGVFGRATWRSDPQCGDLQTVDFDILSGESLSLPAQQINVTFVYPNGNPDYAPLPPPVTFPPLEVNANLGRGTIRNAFVARRTLPAAIVGAQSRLVRVPNFASAAILVNATGVATATLNYYSAINGGVVSSSVLGKGLQNAVPVPQGGLFACLVGAADPTSMIMFTLQI